MQLKNTFDTISQQYDKARLTYPREIVAAIKKYQSLDKADHILEIGIGTGKATPPFARSGYRITAIDPGKKPLTVAKQNLKQYKNIRYINQSFEKAKLHNELFTLAYSAQAFHWIDPKIGLPKLHNVLTDDGVLAFFWNIHDHQKSGSGEDIRTLYKKYRMIPKKRITHQGAIQSIQQSKLFTDVQIKKFHRVLRMSKRQRLALVTTYSAAIALKKDRYELYVADVNKSLEKYPSPLRIPMTTILILARKR